MKFFQVQLPLFYSYKDFGDAPVYDKYFGIFSELDFSHIPSHNRGVGANGVSQHALIRAFIIQKLENLKTVAALINFLDANPLLKTLCGFENARLPHNSQFYRFINKTNHSLFENLLFEANKKVIGKDVISTEQIAVDSKPIRALTKENNPKNSGRNLKDKDKIPKRNPHATLGYYACVKNGNVKKTEFFWGYRTHCIVDVNSGIALVEGTFANNRTDAEIAKKLLRKLKRLYKIKKGIIVIADKAYDENSLYKFIIEQIKGEAVIPINPRNSKPNKDFSVNGNRICQAGLEMVPAGTWTDGERIRMKQRCPLKASKQTAEKFRNQCPYGNPKFSQGAAYGCTAYLQVNLEDYRYRTPRNTPRFEALYKKRIVVEQLFSRVDSEGIEDARQYKLRGIRNSNTISYLALSLVALTAMRMKKPSKIRSLRTFGRTA